MSKHTGLRKLADKYMDHREEDPRTKLTAGQHVLHLLLSVFTFGLWLPVWIYRAWRGNPAPRPEQ